MKKQNILSKIFLTSMLLAIPACTGIGLVGINSYAETSITGAYSENISVSNSSFNSSSSTYSKNDVTGWTRIKGDGIATTMIIDTDSSFSKLRTSPYYLSCDNPNSAGTKDTKILMINSAIKSGQTDGYTREGYQSNSISLSEKSYYVFKVAVKTKSFNEAKEFASIYLSGLKDKDGKNVNLAFEQKSAGEWTNFYFFVATGDESQTVTLDLWLGSQDINSYGVAFFDEVTVTKYSENLFYDILENSHAGYNSVTSKTKYLKLDSSRTFIDVSGYNFDFEEDKSSETDNLPKWDIVNSETVSTKAHAEPINMESKEYFENKVGKAYPGTDFTNGNKQSLVLWTEESSNITIESKELPIKAHGCYKITMLVKTNLESGSFKLKVKETESIYTAFPSIKTSYTLHSGESSEITSTSSNSYSNNYQEVSFYIQGHNLYNSAVKLQLALGSTEAGALGYVIVDNITVETIASADLGSSNMLSLLPSSASSTIKNGMFNFVSTNKSELTYPLLPSNWEVSQDENEYTTAGIINTYSAYYAEYSTETWGSLPNPAMITDAPLDETKSNNVFMFWNGLNGYQSLKNVDTFQIASGNYYDLSFQYKTYTGELTVEVVNDDGVVLFSDENISAQASWNTYHAYIYTGEVSHDVRVIIHFGTEKKQQKGYAFLDNVVLNSTTETVYNSASRHIDLSNLLLNLDSYNTVNSNISEHPAFSGTITAGNDAEGGVIIGNGNTSFTDQNNNPIDKDQDLPNNVLVMSVGEGSSYKLTSKFKLDVSSDSEKQYYSLKFKAMTCYFPKLEDMPVKDEDGKEIEYSYGLSVGLSNFNAITQILSNEGWTEYTILFKATTTESVSLEFALISNNENVYGSAYITDIIWENTDEATYTASEGKTEYNKTLFTTQTSTTADEDTSNEEEENNSTENNTSSENYAWILIPSIITAIAVIIAVVGAFMRKISIGKKIKESKEKKVAEKDYDRKDKLDKTYIKNEAKKLKAQEVEKVEKDIKTISEELELLDKEHKEYIEESRKINGGKVTKEIERQFKLYSSKRAKLSDKLQKAKENLETINSPEYILVLEKKVSNLSKTKSEKKK